MTTKLNEEKIAENLEQLEGWTRKNEKYIQRTWEFGDFDEAMTFINKVADVARKLDHHPELFNVYNRVRLEMSTHDADGLTDKDFHFAQLANSLG